MPSKKCAICVSPERSAIEADRLEGLPYHTLAEKYPFSRRQLQYHLTRHFEVPKPDASPTELQQRLDGLLQRAEALVKEDTGATFSQRTKALTTVNTIMRTCLQVSGMLKALAPAGQISHDFSQSYEYRVLVAKINEAVVCSGCRTKLLEVIHASS